MPLDRGPVLDPSQSILPERASYSECGNAGAGGAGPSRARGRARGAKFVAGGPGRAARLVARACACVVVRGPRRVRILRSSSERE